jgi:hypothetical protein
MPARAVAEAKKAKAAKAKRDDPLAIYEPARRRLAAKS